MTQNPKYFDAILSNQKQLRKNNQYSFLHEWLGDGLLVSSGRKWHSRRKIITPAFHFQILQEFVDVFNYQNEIFIEKIKEIQSEKTFDVYNMVTSMSLDIISQTAMSVELQAQSKESAYTTAVKE
jgi:cytochrome P450 family 4